ncbi:pyruvate dehydrogenase complex dihydrolipoamide acetyltransferase [Hyphobacterium sp. HN65]|uniref:Acetyltransferase component of pyruvate dehydrogenase complex n=1 Tax=Hyphobacterium lacteum TaxID=3116575 RepID=A0ABU7LM00_9PROT|nr:pyruvate dehydrogenase complex dihydrolipoamide acetyltransferase [Hyphobacterium sp. HN65]MEE2524929.1 pyruvate dehydrogenase complex dihydrolipoamide acetyltransferase [Hyphobacterium sp. HN65]
MPIEVLMPALSPTMEEGTLARWLVKEGDSVASGDLIAEIETDKATMEVEAVDEGKIGKLLVAEGSDGVKVNEVIALLLEDDEDASALEGFKAGGAAAPAPAKESAPATPSKPETAATPAPEPVKAATPATGDRIKASPLARRMATQSGIDLSAVVGSGPNGRIVKRDIESFDGKTAGAPAATSVASAMTAPDTPREISQDEPLAAYGISADRYVVEKADNITKISAKRLSESFRDVPHFPLNVDCELDRLLAFRKEMNERAPDGVKVSVNDILIKAAGLALKFVPEANSSWIEDGRIARHKHADVSVAVAIEGGLITPIIRDADTKGLAQISSEMKDLAARARDRKLKPEEFQGGTFSLSNLGMFGIKSFASILNPPQGMILSVGAGEERPVVKDGALAKATVMTVTLTCDHRVVDGATGAKWIAAFKGFVEDPMTMLM